MSKHSLFKRNLTLALATLTAFGAGYTPVTHGMESTQKNFGSSLISAEDFRKSAERYCYGELAFEIDLYSELKHNMKPSVQKTLLDELLNKVQTQALGMLQELKTKHPMISKRLTKDMTRDGSFAATFVTRLTNALLYATDYGVGNLPDGDTLALAKDACRKLYLLASHLFIVNNKEFYIACHAMPILIRHLDQLHKLNNRITRMSCPPLEYSKRTLDDKDKSMWERLKEQTY